MSKYTQEELLHKCKVRIKRSNLFYNGDDYVRASIIDNYDAGELVMSTVNDANGNRIARFKFEDIKLELDNYSALVLFDETLQQAILDEKQRYEFNKRVVLDKL